MATFHKGNGGKAVIGGADFNITDWELTKDGRLAETTHSGTAGWSRYQGTVKHAQWTMNLPWDSEDIPDTDRTLDIGDVLTLTLHCGDSGKTYIVTSTTVSSVRTVVNNQNEIVRSTVSGMGGTVTDPVT